MPTTHQRPNDGFRSDLEQYIQLVSITLLTRLRTSKADIDVYYVVYLMHTMAIQVEGLASWDTSAVCGLTQLARANQSIEDHNSVPGVFR